MPALHTLEIANYGDCHIGMISLLQDGLIEEDLWDDFRQLKVSSCLNAHRLDKSYGAQGKKIVWRDNDR